MVRGWVAERSMLECEVDGREMEGRGLLRRWAQAPSSLGTGRSAG